MNFPENAPCLNDTLGTSLVSPRAVVTDLCAHDGALMVLLENGDTWFRVPVDPELTGSSTISDIRDAVESRPLTFKEAVVLMSRWDVGRFRTEIRNILVQHRQRLLSRHAEHMAEFHRTEGYDCEDAPKQVQAERASSPAPNQVSIKSERPKIMDKTIVTRVLDSAKEEAPDGAWRAGAEHTIQLLREPTLEYLRPRLGKTSASFLTKFLSTPMGEIAFAYILGGAISGLGLVAPEVASGPKATRLAKEIRTYAFYRVSFLLMGILTGPVREVFKDILAQLPDVKATPEG